jgi:hypothetical protein
MSLTSSLLYGACCIVKPTGIVFLPLMVYRLGVLSLVSVAVFGGYCCWLGRFHAGRRQLEFFKRIGAHLRVKRSFRGRLRTLKRRGRTYQRTRVLVSLLFYLYPLYLSYSWEQCVVSLALLAVAPNVKYFVLVHVL